MAIIYGSDWTPVENKMRSVLSTPDATTTDLGYNTTYSRSAVAATQVITGAQWNALKDDVNKAIKLQTGADSDLTARGSTDIITANDFTTISGKVDTAYNNRGNISTGQLNVVAGSGLSNVGGWTSSLTLSNNITWSSNDKWRGFWNGGGRIVITFSRSGGSTNSQNSAWTNLGTNMGSLVLTRTGMFQSGQAWNGTFYNNWNTNGAYSNMTTSATRAFSISSQDTNYTANYFDVYLRMDTANAKTAKVLYYDIYAVDNHTASGAGPDTVDGTFTISVNVYYPFSNNP